MEVLGEHPTLSELSTQDRLMDSPCFMWFSFLILIVAAPCPNIAMPSDDPAKGTPDYSFDKTYVAVYHCEDWESNVCQSSNYENCVKIGETQNEKFSNEVIQLVTSETHIIMCFQQENSIPEGIYAIVWEKATGVGDSCGILNSGVSSENWKGNIIIEKIKTCCEAETNLSVPNLPLKCYTEVSDDKTEKSTGDPQFSISKKSNIVIITTILILGLCGVTLTMYCIRRNRNGQGHYCGCL
ncbi:uncharacterized protein LOC116964022 isoform X2 [Tyto alba]|uniref:uncharacterized protein LOC116964022 isoform X2 n=1 Tax=Tyto alba TaxID=56313 RepID=UPI001402C60F|nr:uncharacterized protein LOC116964022 isoform X2 [Tyto alba]